MNDTMITTCPHCEQALSRWATPPDSSWGGAAHLVCFNDECPFFARGWKWMADKYNVTASYRFKFDPVNQTSGSLPVWSSSAMRDQILDDDNAG